MFYKTPFLLLFLLIGVLLLGPLLSTETQSFIYSLGLFIKSIIIFLLPVLIFCLLYLATSSLAGKAGIFLLASIFALCISNFANTLIGGYIGSLVYKAGITASTPSGRVILESYEIFGLKPFIANEEALFAGILLGVLSPFLQARIRKKISGLLEKTSFLILKAVTLLIPFFILGFLVKLRYEGTFYQIIKNYTGIFAIIALSLYSYCVLLYFLAAGLNFKEFLRDLKNMFPAFVAGFCSMSSAAALPLSVKGVEGNTKRGEIAASVMPITVNVHLIGDCLSIPIFAFAVLKSFDLPAPDFYSYCLFVFYFVLAKFSVAAVPGGGIIVMLPILQNYMGFNDDSCLLITALYILFDPIITSANILGNGFLAKVIDRLNIYAPRKNIQYNA